MHSHIGARAQSGVPDTIGKMRRAGMRVAMVTGDKADTALNIATSAALVARHDTVVTATVEGAGSVAAGLALLVATAAELRGGGGGRPGPRGGGGVAVVVDDKVIDASLFCDGGAALAAVVDRASGVVCCRCRPDQKARIVGALHLHLPGARTLAVGDGANDVGMIEAAHVGVGIAGGESSHAANAADFSIGQFRFLQRLLLVHGHWNYRRICVIVMLSLYKSVRRALARPRLHPRG